MTVLADIQYSANRAARRVFGPAAAACLVVYFAYYAVYGDRGLMSLRTLEDRVAEREAILDKTRAERIDIEHRVALLRPESLDPDMVDEQARRILNYTLPNEVVVLVGRGAMPPTVMAATPTATVR